MENIEQMKNKKPLDWDDLRFFLAVAAAGSLSAAARALHVNTTTVLRRIAHLEEAFDTRLFERLRSGYTLTVTGTRLLQELDPVDQKLSALIRDFHAGRDGVQGVVKIAMGETIATHSIAPALGEFQQKLPHIALEIITDPTLTGPGSAPRIINILRDIDIAIRLARPTQGDMLVRKLGDMAYGLYATQDYIDAHPPFRADDLSGQNIIGFSEAETPIGPIWWLSHAQRDADIIMRSSSAIVRLKAAQCGIGITALPCVLADKYEMLKCLADSTLIGRLEIWLLTRPDLAKLAHVRAVMDFLIQHMQEK